MQIVRYPHPALFWKSKPITRIDRELQQTVDEMFELMYTHNGIGLAANQVALPFRLFVMNGTGDRNQPDAEWVFVNPEIVGRKGTIEAEEGCLSVPEVYGEVRRAEKIVVNAFDLDGKEFELALDELEARVVQHEVDHLDGVLFVDRMTDAKRREIELRLADFESHFRRQQATGVFPPDEEIRRTLQNLEPTQGETA
jgi:peptide deformylase